MAHRQAKLVGFASRFSIKRELTNSSRAPPVHTLLQTRMGNHEASVIQHIMADEIVNKISHLWLEFRRLTCQLRKRFRKPVCNLNISATQLAH